MWGSGGIAPPFLTSALDGGEYSINYWNLIEIVLAVSKKISVWGGGGLIWRGHIFRAKYLYPTVHALARRTSTYSYLQTGGRHFKNQTFVFRAAHDVYFSSYLEIDFLLYHNSFSNILRIWESKNLCKDIAHTSPYTRTCTAALGYVILETNSTLVGRPLLVADYRS
jgi:hypothetical protein